jgi:hypothetical protein
MAATIRELRARIVELEEQLEAARRDTPRRK